jgi:hypothetical protein
MSRRYSLFLRPRHTPTIKGPRTHDFQLVGA